MSEKRHFMHMLNDQWARGKFLTVSLNPRPDRMPKGCGDALTFLDGIIAVTGEYDLSTLREILYSIVSINYNARRNLERTESEFSIPLTILGVLYYPNGYLQWIFLILKIFIIRVKSQHVNKTHNRQLQKNPKAW